MLSDSIVDSIYVSDPLSALVSLKDNDDIKVIVAISWTYIIIAELLNSTGGIGSMIFKAARQSQTDQVFALLGVIVVIGIIQDKLFKWLDKILFPHKHLNKA